MYKISTVFIKAQIPEATLDGIIKLYINELKNQSVDNISVKDNTILFSNDLIRLYTNRWADKFWHFSTGQIKLVDENKKFVIYLTADTSRAYKVAGIPSIIICSIFLLLLGVQIVPFFLVFCFFSFNILAHLISLYVFFPIYFESVRNDIEKRFQQQ
ncbi:MAG TPA: hypothetical protein PKH93_00200 [Chitinophagales bacterium]|nr:hypothetical protein [Chitinophagales bacterium]